MSEQQAEPILDDIIEPTEEVYPDHSEHAKTPHPLDDDALERRAERERRETGADGPVGPR